MKNLLPFIALAALLAASCKNDPEKTDSFVHSRIDSLVGTRMEEVNCHAEDDLEQRMTIEVKAKADSIVAARRAAAAKTDSARNKQVSQPNAATPARP